MCKSVLNNIFREQPGKYGKSMSREINYEYIKTYQHCTQFIHADRFNRETKMTYRFNFQSACPAHFDT